MPIEYTPTLNWLVWTLVATGLMWIPYIAHLLVTLGPVEALMEGGGAEPDDATWARRCKKAHYNAIENLAIFAPLTLIACALGLDNQLTAAAALAYMLIRLLHYVVYTLGLPLVRTLLFLGGVGCQAVMLGRIVGWV